MGEGLARATSQTVVTPDYFDLLATYFADITEKLS